MNDKNAIDDASSIQQKLMQRVALMEAVQRLDSDIAMQLKQSAESAYQPLSQESVSRMIEQNMAGLKVTELCAIAGLAPATYYNLMSKVGSIKTSSLQSLLNTIGLDLFIGKRQALAGTKDVDE